MDLNKDFVKQVSPAIYAVWGGVAPDANCEDNEEALELVLDADRMTYGGYPEQDALVEAAIKEHGWTTVSRFLAKHIHLC